MLNFFEHFDNQKLIMSSTGVKNSTISSSGSNSSASTNQMSTMNQNSTPTSSNPPSFYFNAQQTVSGNSTQNSQIINNPSHTPNTPTLSTSVNTNTSTYTPTIAVNNNSNTSIPHEEKIYKKEKQILVEFESKTKDLKSQLGEGTKCLEQRLETQISILYELQDFFKKRAEVELQYSRDLDKLTKNILSKHKSEKSKRETWHLHSTFKLWESLLNDTKQHSKYHQVASEICSKYISEKFDVIVDDIKRIFTKCKNVGQVSHDEIFKVVGELNGAMKTYHEYQSESKQAEAKLKYVQSQKPKFEKQKSKKKLKQFEKQVEKRLQKYTETKVKAFKARNEYILSIDSANACINKFCTEDIGDIVDCSDFGFHASIARCIYMYLSAQENIKRSRQMSVDNLSRSIGDLDSTTDKQKFLEYFQYVFNIQKKFQFEAHKGDEVSQVNAQSLIRYEMEKRFEQLDNRLKTLKTENNEIFKTIEATEESLLNFFDVKNNCDMSDLFRDLNLTNQNTANSKDKRVEIEDYYVEKVRQYTTSSNLIARLEARHSMMQKALCGRVNNGELLVDKLSNKSIRDDQTSQKKKIGKSPIIGQPRLFGGKLIEYINATKQEIPPIITSCIKAINRLGLHNQGIFRIPGSQLEINQFKESFEKGEDPLVTVNPREMNSVAGVLKLYLRELKDPLFPRDMYDSFLNAMRINHDSISQSVGLPGNEPGSPDSSSPNCIRVENLEAHKVENIRKVMDNVPKSVYNVLRYLFAFLNHLSEFKDENMMDAYNIAICLAPTLIPVPEEKRDQVNHQTDTIELIKIIIQNSDDIFSTDIEGPLYEKFDSDELDNVEDNCIDDSSEDEEEESERQFMRNLSDDEFYATEAIALYDYRGRSDKELSFKKGDWLSIKGQLSADWWQGSLANQPKDAYNPDKYIPDKYIALRSSKRKYSANSTQNSIIQSMTTPSSASTLNFTPDRMTISMNQKSLSSTPTGSISHKNHAKTVGIVSSNQMLREALLSNNMTSSQITNDSESLSELLQAKESDILDNDDTESVVSEAVSMILNNNTNSQLNYQNQVKYQNMMRSSSSNSTASNSYTPNNHVIKQSSEIQRRVSLKKQRNLSASSSIIDQSMSQNTKNSPRNINQQLINFDNLLNNKQQLKMHHIEDALASVLDDMKQLDFSTSASTQNVSNPSKVNCSSSDNLNTSNNLGGGNNKIITNLVSSLSSSQAPSSSSSSSTSSSTSSNNGLSINKNLNQLNKNDFGENLSQSSDDELRLKRERNLNTNSASIKDNQNNNSNAKNILSSQKPSSGRVVIGSPSTSQTIHGINKRPDLVLDLPVNLLISPSKQSNSQSVNASTMPNCKVRRKSENAIGLNSSSTSSTESSSISSSASTKKNFSHNRAGSSQTVTNNILLSSATAAVEQALNYVNTTGKRSNSIVSSLKDDDLTSKSFNESLDATKSELSFTQSSSVRKQSLTSDDHDVESLRDDNCDKDFREKLEEFKNTNYCSIDEFNTLSLASENAIDYVELNNEDPNNDDPERVFDEEPDRTPSPPLPPPPVPPEYEEQKTSRSSCKKQPPPVMKKPEKSEEILRKLGRGADSVSPQFGTVSSVSSTSSSVHDRVSNSSTSNTENSVSIRLSTSKATDV